METANRDMFPVDGMRSAFESVAPLLSQPVIDEAFARRDAAAIKGKRRYHGYGQFAIGLIAFGAVYTLAEALILPAYPGNNIVSAIVALLAGVAIAVQIYVIATRQKTTWLLNRYAVERLRSLKFQAFIVAQTSETVDDMEAAANAFAVRETARLDNELNGGIAVIRAFVPDKAIASTDAPRKPVNRDLADAARDAYLELRVTYQKRFAQSELARFGENKRVSDSSQDIIYLAAAAFAFLSLGAKVLLQGQESPVVDWFDFLAVAMFILGATKAIMDNASLEQQSQTRYEQYVRDIEQVAERGQARGASLVDLVRDMEALCLHELDDFCRAGERISYRL